MIVAFQDQWVVGCSRVLGNKELIMSPWLIHSCAGEPMIVLTIYGKVLLQKFLHIANSIPLEIRDTYYI